MMADELNDGLKKDNAKEGAKDDEAIDFAKLGHQLKIFLKAKSLPGEKSAARSGEEKSPEEINFDPIAFWKKHRRWIIPLFCILLAVSVSIYLRTMPQRLPIAEDWAENTVTRFYRSNLEQQISQQYPNLPAQNKEVLVDKEWQKIQNENKPRLEQDIAQLSQQYRNFFSDENGTPYLLGIDPYYYYRMTALVLQNGHPGTELRDGVSWDMYRLAPLGREQEPTFHAWFGAWWHRFLNLFGDFPLMFTFFLVGTLFSALTVIPGFFIGKRITKNNVGGFFTAILLAVSAFFVSRTTGESSDTDVYAVFFPVLITWLFLEALEGKELKKRIIWISLAGLATGLFAFAWTGWWYIATFILAAFAWEFIQIIATHWKQWRTTIRSSGTWHPLLHPLYTLGVYILSSALSISLFTSWTQFARMVFGPFGFLKLKSVAVYGYWPNIRTTVAELNVPSFDKVIGQLDGRFLFALAILGIFFLALRKNESGRRSFTIPFFLALWLAAALFATTKGMRFILQVTPVFAIALGAFLGVVWLYASRWSAKELKLPELIPQVVIFIILAFLLVQPIKSGYSQAHNSVSNMNDAWYNALSKIREEAPKNAIITSWWDFGHWFKAIADRPVTFDGGTQVGWGAHWVGKSLLTHDEKMAVGIIRMLNCGQNTAFGKLDEMWKDILKEIELLNKIMVQDKATAEKTLQEYGLTTVQTEELLQYTHCDPPSDYFITSDDMIGKAGVWGHFGSWDFRRAVIYQTIKKMNGADAAAYLAETFNFSRSEAERVYGEVQTTEADRWIAPWPSYLSGLNPCQTLSDQEIRCVGNVQGSGFIFKVDLAKGLATIEGSEAVLNAVVYPTKEGLVEKEQQGNKIGVSVILLPRNEKEYNFLLADPLQAGSVFSKLFFLRGHGLRCFSPFGAVSGNGQEIYTWRVDYDCQQKNQVYFQPKEEVQAAHILISTESRGEQGALQLAQEIRKNLTAANFAEYAQKYSEDPGSKTQGGDLNWFGKGAMVAPFEEAAFSLRKGQISQPVKTPFGYHLILVKDKRSS